MWVIVYKWLAFYALRYHIIMANINQFFLDQSEELKRIRIPPDSLTLRNSGRTKGNFFCLSLPLPSYFQLSGSHLFLVLWSIWQIIHELSTLHFYLPELLISATNYPNWRQLSTIACLDIDRDPPNRFLLLYTTSQGHNSRPILMYHGTDRGNLVI